MRWYQKVLLLVLASISCCCEEKRESLLPDTDVYIHISLTLPQFNSLNFVGNAVLVQGKGYKGNGVYVVRITEEDFAAYDATCVDHLDKPTATQLTGTRAKCPECKTEYELLNYGFSLDESQHLQSYRVEKVPNTPAITVRN